MRKLLFLVSVQFSIVLVFCVLDVAAQSDGICERTPQVRSEILSRIGVSGLTCGEVTSDQLSKITKLYLHRRSIVSLREDDFDGLSSLQELWLDRNSLTTLPPGVFAGLSSLRDLFLFDNSLTTLDADVFAGLSSLRRLYLYDNSLTTLPAGVFAGLSSLEVLYLYKNSLSTIPADLIDGLSSLKVLSLHWNSLTTLPADMFDENQSPSIILRIHYNPIICLPPKIVNNDKVEIKFYGSIIKCGDIALTVSPGSVGESASATTVTVTATMNTDSPDEDTEVSVSVGSGTAKSGEDFTAVDEFTMTIKANRSDTTETFTLTPTSDDVDEGDETVTVTGTATELKVDGTVLTIIDDDTVGLDVSPVTLEIDEGSAQADSFRVNLESEPAGGEVTVKITGHVDTDVHLSSSTLTFNSENWDTAQYVKVTATSDDDSVDDVVPLKLEASGAGYGDVPDETVTVTVVDNTPSLEISPGTLSLAEGDSEDFTVRLSLAPNEDVKVAIAGHAGTALELSNDTLTFTPTKWNDAQPVTVTAVADDNLVGENPILTLTAERG